MNRFHEAFTIVLAVVVVGAEAFAPTTGLKTADSNRRGSSRRRGPRTLARASFYYPEDDGRYSDNHDEYDDASSSSYSSTTITPAYDPSTFFGGTGHGGGVAPPSSSSSSYSSSSSSSSEQQLDVFFDSGHDYDYGGLLGRIADQLPRSTLARLASAYPPPGHDIAIEHVNDVRCRNLDGNGIEIEAVVCDSVECASLLVPVNFPEGCIVATMDDYRGGGGGRRSQPKPVAVVMDCILRNVERLDVVGADLLRERGEARRTYEALRSLGGGTGGGGGGGGGGIEGTTSSAEMPDWWEMPITDEDVSECDLMRHVLNGEDMRDMVLELAANLAVGGGCSEVRDVRVDAVGPVGMVLRARLSAAVAVDGGGTYDDEDSATLTDVPVRFADMISSGHYSGSIRQRVLALFS